MTSAADPSHVMRQSEYDAAASQFIGATIKALVEAQGGIYSLVTKEHVDQLPDYSTMGSDPIENRPIDVYFDGTISFDDVVTGDFDGLLAMMDRAAAQMNQQFNDQILAHISEACNSQGFTTTVSEISHETIIEVIENLVFSFDENGNPNIGAVITPEASAKLKALGPPTAEQQARMDEIIARRRDEWNARRNGRSLPSRRN